MGEMNWRNTDPITSREAAQEITASGKRQSIQDTCLAYVRNHPGETAGEIGDGTGLGHDKVWRRLSDLKNKGRIVMGDPRVWNGRRQGTWYIAWEITPKQEPVATLTFQREDGHTIKLSYDENFEQTTMDLGDLYKPPDRRH